jgi:hypothetical protein
MDLPCSSGPEYPLWSLTSIPGGFVAGAGVATLNYYAFEETLDQVMYDHLFSLVKSVPIELISGSITSIALSPNEELLCCATSDGQIITAPAVNAKNISPSNLNYSIAPFHGPKSVVGMDVATKKPIMATCSKDNTLRIWNFQTHELELTKLFPEDMFSVAVHPNGLHLAIGFTDKLRVYHILVDDIRLSMEVSIKSCRECRFGKGGHVLAAANGNSISVFDFHTGEKIVDLRGHNSKVRGLNWLDTGCQLLSCGQDGAVYIWDLDGARRISEFVQKGTIYTCAVTSGDSVFVVGSDRCLRELTMPDLAIHKSADAGLVLTNVALSIKNSVLFAGTAEIGKPGYVRAYSYPVTGDYDEYPCTQSQISRMKLTPDENFLIVTDEMGCVVVLELRDKQDRFSRLNTSNLPELLTLDSWSDEVLVTYAELEDLSNTITELQTKVEELKLHNEYQLKLKEMNYSEKIKEVTDNFVQELEQSKTNLELLKEERSDCEIEHLEKLKQVMEKHQHGVQEMETGFQSQIMELVDGYQQLAKDRDAQLERLEEQRRQLVNSHERYVDELTQDFESKLDDDRQSRLQYEDEKIEMDNELSETQNQLEDDIDSEIENMRRLFEEKLSTCRESTLKYKGENGIMKKKFIVMQRDLDDQKDEMRVLQEKEKDLHEQIKMLEREVSAHKKEIKTRDVSIGEKEKRIYELKKKNQELDKFKFVLDFKIRELKRQIEPRQMEILGMRDQIMKMDKELEKYHKGNSNLDEMIGTLRARIDEMQSETKNKRLQAKTQETSISTFRSDVQLLIAHILIPDLLKPGAIKLIESHGAAGSVRPRVDPEIEGEYSRHKGFLQKSIVQMKRALENGTTEHMKSNNGLMQDNLGLIKEINTQRENNRGLKEKIQSDMGRVRQWAQAMSEKSKNRVDFGMETPGNKQGMFEDETQDPSRQLERNRARILALRAAILNIETRHHVGKSYSQLPSLVKIDSQAYLTEVQQPDEEFIVEDQVNDVDMVDQENL